VPFAILLILALLAGLGTMAVSSLWPAANVAAPGAITEATSAVAETVAQHRRLRRFVANRVDPSVITGLALTVALLLAVGGGLVLALLAYLVRSNSQLRHIDNGVARWGRDHAGPVSTRGLDLVTQLGSVWVVIGLAVGVAVVESFRRPSRWIVPFLLLAVGGEELLTITVKELADRTRPAFNPVAATLGPSFPSGHSATAAAFYASAALLIARGRSPRWRSVLAGSAVGIAVGVAASRVLLDVHWLSDVIAGLALGWGWFAICSVAFGGRLLRYARPAEQVVEAADAAGRTDAGRRLPAAR
jgi:membrane-associated phospholipid phosphatase